MQTSVAVLSSSNRKAVVGLVMVAAVVMLTDHEVTELCSGRVRQPVILYTEEHLLPCEVFAFLGDDVYHKLIATL